MALPALPSLGQNPWYETRTNWDNALASLVQSLPGNDLTNRVPNSSLSDVTAGVASGWTRSGLASAVNVVNVPELPGPMWKLDGVGSQVGVYSPYFDVTPSGRYTYSVAVRGSLTGTATGVVRIVYTDSAGASAGQFSANITLPGETTSVQSFRVVAPANAVRARVFILHASSATAGSWYAGQISVLRRSEILGPIQYPGDTGTSIEARIVTNDDANGISGNLYGSGYTTPSGYAISRGSSSVPTSDARPVFWSQKFSSSNRSTNPQEWDQGAGYFGLEKRSGDAYGAALTGYGRHESSAGGDLIGVHGRASAYQPASKVWGGWFYAHAGDPATVPVSIIGIEVNLNSRIPDQGYTPATGYSKGLLVVTQDSSLPVSMGIEVGRGTAAPDGYFHTGFKIRRDSVLTSPANTATGITENEAVLIEGATNISGSANGIRFGFGNYRTGLSFAEATISNNAAIVMGENHRIIVGPGAGVTTYAEFSRNSNFFNLSNLNLHVNGSKVVGPRRTGWASPTGTATRTAFDTTSVTLQGLAERLKALIDDLNTGGHGLIGA